MTRNYTTQIQDWADGHINVVIAGNLTICENSIYSYQKKIGFRDSTMGTVFLLDRKLSPSVTTTRHIGMVLGALSAHHETYELMDESRILSGVG